MNKKRFLTYVLLVGLAIAAGPRIAQTSPAPPLARALSEIEELALSVSSVTEELAFPRTILGFTLQETITAPADGNSVVSTARMGSSGLFADSGQSLGSSHSRDMALGDVDGDGDLDAFVANTTSLLPGGQPNKVWLNDGAGTFSDSGQALGSSASAGVALGDVDSDGDLDAFVANGGDQANKVWLNNGAGTFSDSGQSLGSSFSLAVALGDVDSDGDFDAFIGNSGGQANMVWLNDGTGTFSDSGQSLGSSNSFGVVLADLDGDLDLDAFVANHDWPSGAANKVWLNDGMGTFSDSGQSLGSSYSYDVALGDVDGDGDLDAFVVNVLAQANKVWLNDGTGIFSDSGQSLGSLYSFGVALGDVDGDGDLDAFVANSLLPGGQPNTVWLNDGMGTFSDSGQSLGSSASTKVVLGDVNGDGDLDAFVANQGNQANKVWLNDCVFGRVTNAYDDSPVPGVAMTVSQDTWYGPREYATGTTESNGHYRIAVSPYINSYYISPSKSGYVFIPSLYLFRVPPGDIEKNFNAFATLSISGRVMDPGGAPIPGAAVDNDAGRFAVTNSDGNYAFHRLPPGPYTLMPSKSSYTFSPESYSLNLSEDRTELDFTGQVGPSMLNLTVSAIEVSQAIQTPDNSVPLVADRRTVARVQIGVQNDAPIAGVTALLHGLRNGTELLPPLAPFNPDGSITAPLVPDREQFDHTLNFLLPESWTKEGDLTLWAEVNPDGIVVEDDYGDNRGVDYALYFQKIPPLQVHIIPVAFQEYAPTLDESNNFGLYTLPQRIYPIPGIIMNLHSQYTYEGDLRSESAWEKLSLDLHRLSIIAPSGFDPNVTTLRYGVLPLEARFGGIVGVYQFELTSIGLVNNSTVAAHEMGHSLRLSHAPCGGAAYPDPDYPYGGGLIGHVGVDVYDLQPISSGHKDVMGYCSPEWISDYHYVKLIMRLLPTHTPPAPPQREQEGWLVSGQISPDGTSASLDYAWPISTTNIQAGSEGFGYRIELRDTSDVIQYSTVFTPNQAIAQDGTTFSSQFALVVPRIPDLGSIQFWRDDTHLANLPAANAPPILQVSHIRSGDQVTVSWQASSPDGTPTLVSILYSHDGGQIWQGLALDLTTDSLNLDASKLPGSANGFIEVIANNTTKVQTARLEIGPVSNKPPQAAIFGDKIIQRRTGEPLILTGSAIDLEDGSIPDANLHWSHPQIGVLGTGRTIILPQGLAEGEHTIILTATDSAGAQDQTTVIVTVTPSHPVVWSNICVAERIEITGIGMGDRDHTINPQTLSLADPASVNWLLAQMAGRSTTVPDGVAFTTDAPQSLTMIEPSSGTPHGYTFEASLQPTSQVTTSVSNPGNSYKTPRGLILYSKRATAGEWWTSVGKTTNEYVYRESHTEVLTFPPLEEATDLFVTAVVIDNDDDARPMVLEAIACDVTETVTELGPTDGAGLNIVNLTLAQVLTGTSQVSVTLRSPSGNGDSLVLVGLNVSYTCLRPTGAVLHVAPSPATIPLGATGLLTVTVTPGPAEVNGVQVHGQVDPTYLHLLDVRPTGVLTTEIVSPGFDPATGVFSYSAGILGSVLTEPFPVLVLEVQALEITDGTWVEFLDDFPPTDVSGPEGSVLSQAQDGLVIVTPPPTLRGTVDMQGRPAKPAPPWAVPLTVWLTPSGSDTPTHTFTTTTNLNGTFELYLDNVIPGLYDVRVKGNHTLRNLARDVSLVSGDNPYFLGRLLEGDAETAATFNHVRQADADVLIGSFNRCNGDPGFVANADLDESSCVLLPDFGLLSGNFGNEGDIVVTPTASLRSGLRQTSGGGALMAFNVEEMEVTVGEVVNLTLDVDPRGQSVNGGMVHLRFDPALVEVVDVALTERLPLVLEEPLVDNEQGVVRFAAGILGQTITERFSIATLSLKVKADTTSTTITPVDAVPQTDVSGPAGSVLAETRGVTLRTETQGGTEHTVYLPIVIK